MTFVWFLLGLCMGSFALAMTYRMHARRNWVSDRSACDACHHVLAWYDLVPLLSWVSTGGKCRYCKTRLSWQYPLTELGCGFVFVASYLFWPFGFSLVGRVQFGIWLCMMTLLASLVIFDLNWYILPDRIVAVLVGFAVLSQAVWMIDARSVERIPGIVVGCLVGSGLFYALYQLSRGAYIGGGDVKFGLVYGVLLGSGIKSLLVISLASIAGTVIALPMLVWRRKGLKAQIPFGPYLILATFVLYIWGARFLEFYSTFYIFP